MGTCFSADNSRGEDERPYNPDLNHQQAAPAVSTDNVKLHLDFDGKAFHSTYQLGEIIGEGAFSQVRSATVTKPGQHKGLQVAVKCIDRNNLPREDEEDLLEEVRILRSLKHPNVIDIYQFFKDDPNMYYVSIEYMRGGELFDRIVQKAYYNEKEARDLCRILLDAVRYCHDLGIVHRDLKPENLLLTSQHDDANVKLADFGFARSIMNGFVSTQCGTPGYVAPEILRAESYGTSVDMWSIGVIIYILLGGYPPFHDENQTRLFRKIKAGNFKFHPEYWQSISNEAKDLIRRLLTVDPKRRLTAAQAVTHPWLLSKDADLLNHNLGVNLEQLKLFNARRKLRAAIKSVLATQKLAKTFSIEEL
eukprot:g10337.t1